MAILLFALTAWRLPSEINSNCWAASDLTSQFIKTERTNFAPTMKAFMIMIIIYYIIDFIRCGLFLLSLLLKSDCLLFFYHYSVINELILYVLVIGVPVVRHTYKG